MTEQPTSRPVWQKFLPGATPWLGLSLVVLIIDLWTKHWASSTLEYGRPVVINEYLDFTLLHNTGAAFSLLANAGGWQRMFFIVLSTVVSVLLIVWLTRLPRFGRLLLVLALALIVSGAVGNLYDRITLGYVVDFLHFHYEARYWPAFNIADTAICIGVFFMLLDSFLYKEPEAEAEPATEEAGQTSGDDETA
ncbi:MAG: signal peptidase II [Gammaproteobacteria bacterium]